MSLRPGNNKKKGQKHQNTYGFKHNKGSMKTRQILSTPLDFLCDRCLEILEWRINFRKYKPLSNPARCNLCQNKTIYKAYRTICEACATKDLSKKLCTKCGSIVEEYAKPKPRNDPTIGIKKSSDLIELIKTLKKKYQKTVYRKMNSGIKIEYDETKGIVNKENGEIILPLENILKDDDSDEEEEDNDEDQGDNDMENEEKEIEDFKDKKNLDKNCKDELKGNSDNKKDEKINEDKNDEEKDKNNVNFNECFIDTSKSAKDND